MKYQHSPDRYNDTALGEIPPRVEYHKTQETAGEKSASAKGMPAGVVSADGTANLRADQKTKMGGHLSTPSGSKGNAPVSHYNDGEV